MEKIINKRTAFRKGFVTRALMLVLALALLGGILTGCSSGSTTPTLTGSPITADDVSANGLNKDNLSTLADDIAKSKSGWQIREQLVAALNGYDMTADGFDDDDLPEAQPDKAAEFAVNVLKKADEEKNLTTTVGYQTLTRDGVQTLVDCFKTEVDTEVNRGLLDTILYWVGLAFGWMIRVLGFGNFMLGTVFFAILVEIIMLPLGIRQQKKSREQAKLRPKEMAIRKKYAGRTDQATQQKLNQEIQQMYTDAGVNPMSGCLPLLLSMPVIFALYYIVIDPLKYIMGAPAEVSSALNSFATASKAAGGLGLELVSKNGTIEILSLIKDSDLSGLANFQFFTNGQACVDTLMPMMDNVPSFSMFGINFGLTPSFDFSSINAVLLLVPVLTFCVYFLSSKVNRKLTQAAPAQQDAATGCSNKMMDIMMPAMSAWFTFMVPAAVGLYWGIKSVVGMAKQFLLSKMMPMPQFTEADYKAAERELAGKEKNKPVKKSGSKNPNVRSLHHIDDEDEDYGAPAPTKGKAWVEDAPEESVKTSDSVYAEGVTMKEDRPAEDKKLSTGKKKKAAAAEAAAETAAETAAEAATETANGAPAETVAEDPTHNDGE